MGTITIKNLIGGSINIITTGGVDEPAGHEKTWIWFADQENYQEFDWSGEITNSMVSDANNSGEIVKVEIGTNVKSIGNDAFNYCSNLTSITIPNSVTSIEHNAFNSCENLTTITIPNSVTSIGEYAFFGCYNLTEITIGNSVESIGVCAFYGCYGLTSVTIPDSVTSIGRGAFEECCNLTEITIPSSVTSIGSGAFYHCEKLTTASILGFTQAQIRANAEDWKLGYKEDEIIMDLITFPVTVTAKDGTFTL